MWNWQLEVGRMVLYITFPVGLFHYFNQPEVFEKYVTQEKNKYLVGIKKQDWEEGERFKEEMTAELEAKRLQKMEKQYSEMKKKQAA